jgi:HAMP domain-containing protein
MVKSILGNQGIRLKFNLVLTAVFLVGLTIAGWSSYVLLHRNAKAETVRNARLLMDTALAIRGYTTHQVGPQLQPQLTRVFMPQMVPAFAAAQTLGELRKKYPDYGYKEATLNPTNPSNRAADWELDVVATFKNDSAMHEVLGERDTPAGRSLYIAHPIRVTADSCLSCHSTPAAAPQSMIAVYGPSNGFGWKRDEIIGAQVVSVPTALPTRNANHAFITFMSSLIATFALVFVALNLMLTSLIVRPIQRMAAAADAVSTGDFSVPEIPASGADEISKLGASFNRMRRSLQTAMQELSE